MKIVVVGIKNNKTKKTIVTINFTIFTILKSREHNSNKLLKEKQNFNGKEFGIEKYIVQMS